MEYSYQSNFVSIVAIIGAVTAVIALIVIILRMIKRRKQPESVTINIESSDGTKYNIETSKVAPEDLEKLLEVVKKSTSTNRNSTQKKEKGSILVDVLFGIVPAIIALSFVATIIYQVVNEKNIPGVLVNSLTTIIGYYFGIGASNTLSSGKKLTDQAIQQLLAQQGR